MSRNHARDLEIIEEYVTHGMSIVEIGERWDLHHSRIWQILTRAGLDRFDRAGMPSEAEIRQRNALVCRMYESKGIAAIARDLNIAKSTVLEILKQAGVTMRPANKHITRRDTQARDQAVIDLMEAGHSISAISRLLDISRPTVQKIVRTAPDSQETDAKPQGRTRR